MHPLDRLQDFLTGLDSYSCGQAKQPAWELLMEIAEAWATRTGCQPAWLSPVAPTRE